MSMIKKIANRIVCLGLASCLILTAPGAQAYEVVSQLATAQRNFSYTGTAFEYYLKLQGIPSTKNLSKKPAERQQALSQDFEQLQTQILLEYQKLGLLQDPFWAPQLVIDNTQLTALGLWFGIKLLTEGTPEDTQQYLQQAAQSLGEQHPDPLQQKPALIKRTLAQLFDHDTRSKGNAPGSPDKDNHGVTIKKREQNAKQHT